jgi:hypothetical protein
MGMSKWEGFVNKITFTIGPIAVSIEPLQSLPEATNKRRIPLRPRANVSTNPDNQAKLDAQLDTEYEQRKIEYAKEYGQDALDEELKRRGEK